MRCRACNGETAPSFVKVGHQYFECVSCQSVMTASISCDETNNEASDERNQRENNDERIFRFLTLPGIPNGALVVDFGCGDGALVRAMQERGYDAKGIDLDTTLQLKDVDEVSAFSMVEVIEHLYDPIQALKEMAGRLVDRGVIYIETGTIDSAHSTAEESSYCDPRIGHCSMFSIAGLREMCARCGLSMQEINSTSFILRKAKRG